MGVVSVSPVARQATIDSTNDIATATTPAHHEIPNAMICIATIASEIGISPAISHDVGTSTFAMATSMSAAERGSRRAGTS